MAKTDAIPTPDDIIGPAIDAIVALRPAALRHLNHSADSRYADVVKAWRAQAVRSIARLSDELAQRFIDTASGSGLRELIGEPDFGSLALEEGPTRAYGEITLNRTVFAAFGTGVIPIGTKFRRRGNPSAVPLPIASVEYESTEARVVPIGAITTTLPVRATTTGTAGNIVPEVGVVDAAGVELASKLYDAESGVDSTDQWSVATASAGGGSGGLTDDDLRRIAKGQAGGVFGPTDAAIRAGALRGTGVKRFAAFRSLLDDDGSTRPNTRVFCADPSWASSDTWRRAIVQMLQDRWAGFGCRVTVGAVSNVFVRIEATIQLRSSRLLTDTTETTNAAVAALSAYFDDREDWWQWRLGSLRAAITTASRNTLTCTSVTVKDRLGNVLSEPSVNQASATSVNHYYLLGNGFTPTYSGPS